MDQKQPSLEAGRHWAEVLLTYARDLNFWFVPEKPKLDSVSKK